LPDVGLAYAPGRLLLLCVRFGGPNRLRR
jgi:hypothetical protein